MKPVHATLAALTMAALLFGCGLGSTAATTATPSTVPIAPPPQQAPTDTPAATDQPQTTSSPTSLDPCVLVPKDEASTLANYTFGDGVEETNPDGGKRCVYGSQTTNVMNIEVAQAPDVATAKQYKDSFIADIQSQAAQLASQGLVVTQVPDFADGAVQAELNISISGISISGSAFAFLKGTVFFGMSDVSRGQPAPTIDALKGEANTVIGRLP